MLFPFACLVIFLNEFYKVSIHSLSLAATEVSAPLAWSLPNDWGEILLKCSEVISHPAFYKGLRVCWGHLR